MKLNPDDLSVTSFQTSGEAAEAQLVLATYTCDPTLATRCFICPPLTYECV